MLTVRQVLGLVGVAAFVVALVGGAMLFVMAVG